MISVNNLSKNYRVHIKEPGLMASVKGLFNRKWQDKIALNNVTFSVEAGEVIGLIGANGAGKTTLMKLLSGIMYPSSGTASVLGHTPWERQNAFRKQIGLLMGQKAQLWWDLPAADCYLLLKEIYQIPHDEYKKTLDKMSAILNVNHVLKTPIRRLSLGERMKMEIIATLLHQPKVIFLDEPTIGLDIGAQRNMREFIKQYRHEKKPAIIVTSHYMEDIENLCERVVILKEGKTVFDGALKRIQNSYANHKVIKMQFEPLPLNKVTEILQPYDAIEIKEEECSVKVDSKKTASVTSQLLKQLNAKDFSIIEEDISNVIDRVMQGVDVPSVHS